MVSTQCHMHRFGPEVPKLDIVKCIASGSSPDSSKQFLVKTFQGILYGCRRFYHWIGHKILSCFHVKHFEIGPKNIQMTFQTEKIIWGRRCLFSWVCAAAFSVCTVTPLEGRLGNCWSALQFFGFPCRLVNILSMDLGKRWHFIWAAT